MAVIRITAPELYFVTSALSDAEKTWNDPLAQVARKLREDITLRYILGDAGKDWTEYLKLRDTTGEAVLEYGRLEADKQ